MDPRLLLIIAITIVASNADQCSVSYISSNCNYIVQCLNNVDGNLDYSRFTNRHAARMYNEESCQQFITFGGYSVYPITLVFKQSYKDGSLVPKLTNSWSSGNFLNVIQKLDLSDDDYNNTPILKSMQNLVTLNISRNQLTTAVLSNANELNMLSEIDLSHNTIRNIEVNNQPYKNLVKIDLSHNYLVKIPDTIFDQFDNLQILDLSYNFIDILTQLTFEGVKQLTELNLASNRLSDINSSLFRFIELKILNIKENRIKDVKPTDFEQLHNLETLDLSSNIIKSINFNIFKRMNLLRNLYLGNNQLEVLSKDAFSGLQSLTSIDLSKNKFKSLPKGLFHETTILTFLIEENVLEGALEKGTFEGVNVTKLDLSNQFLTEVKDYAFQDLVRLETLLLNSNKIHLLSTMCFKTLSNLQTLDLSNNQIRSIDFYKDDLANLHSLHLKNNYLTEISHEQLQNLDNLEFIDLSDNQITHLEPLSFQSLRNLINLRIDSNPLAGTLESRTFDGLVILPSLDISHSMLTTIQNASFSLMTQLKELNLSHCDISELQYNAFESTGYIESLDLSYNKLDIFLVNTTHLVGIATLLLNNNLLKFVSSYTLHGLPRLSKVLLSHNLIQHVGKESFSSVLDLRYLDLSYNANLTFTADILGKNTNLNTLLLTGINTHINFENLIDESPIVNLVTSNISVYNISTLKLGKLIHLDSLDLSYNNVSELRIGDFTGVRTLRFLDLSFNKIAYIQPGVFKDNTLLHFLNISHNSLSTIGYGIFRGLIYLSILDVSNNYIKDLESERFYELKSLSKLIVDNNKIDILNAEEFVGTTLSILSIGGNPLPCQILVKLKKNGVPFEITAIEIDEHSDENVNGVTCSKDHKSPLRLYNEGENHNGTFNELRNILLNFTSRDNERGSIETLEKITNILEKSQSINDDKLSNLSNLTSEVININNHTNFLISKIIDVLFHSPAVNATTTLVPRTETVIPGTTPRPVKDNKPNGNKTFDIVSYINNITNKLEEAILLQKRNIMNEIEHKLAMNNYRNEPAVTVATQEGHEKLISNNDDTNSYFTEICVALILLILVGMVLYKFYKSRMFIRNRFSFSTRELPGSMENSAL